MKKIALFLAAVMILSMVCFGGCAKVGSSPPQPEQSAVPSTTEPVNSQPPANQPADKEPSDAQDDVHEPFELEIYTLTTGTSTYVMGVALADLINANSTWLHATALASQSVNATAALLLGDKKDCAIGSVTMGIVTSGLPPFTEPSEDLRGIATYSCTGLGFITLNPDIKEMKDLDGKKVMLGAPGAYLRNDIPTLMFQYLEIEPVISTGGFADAANALMNGDIDAIYIGHTALDPEMTEWSIHSSLTEVAARTQLYYIDIDIDAAQWAEQELGLYSDPEPMVIPAGKYDPGFNEDLCINPDYLDWSCHKDLPDYVVTEILRIMSENADKFVDYIACGSFVSPETMAGLQMPEYVHPAAKEFYESLGVWNHDE